MTNSINKILKNKILFIIIIFILIAISYFGYTKIFSRKDSIRYKTAKVQKDTLITSVSGSGQISVLNQIDIKPKASGDIINIKVKNGQKVKAETIIAQLDAKDAQKTVRDAEINLKNAKLSLKKIKKPADALSIIQTENSLTQAKDNLTKLKLSQKTEYDKTLESKQKAEDDLKKTYDDGFNAITNAFLDLPNIIVGIKDMLIKTDLSPIRSNLNYYSDAIAPYDKKSDQYQENTYNAYQIAQKAYDQNFMDFKSMSRFSDTIIIEKLINQTYDTSKNIAESIKNTNNLIQLYQDKLVEQNLTPNSLSDTHLLTLNTYTGKINNHIIALLTIKRTIQTNKETITNTQRDINEMSQNHPLEIISLEQAIKEKKESLNKLKTGADDLDIQSLELTIKQRENALSDAKEKLADYTIRAPFNGIIDNFDIKKGDSISANTTIATLITEQKIAEISLNEVDVAKIKIGQKATFTFDAVPDLTLTGQVIEIDTTGTISQGVVTYIVKIAFDTQDNRIKNAMSVSATIITDAKPDTLLAPNSAIKSQNNTQYVEIMESKDQTPHQQIIKTGLSNDGFTEIIEGLKEGDEIITKTIQPTSVKTKQTQQSSSLKIPGITGGGGGNSGFRGN